MNRYHKRWILCAFFGWLFFFTAKADFISTSVISSGHDANNPLVRIEHKDHRLDCQCFSQIVKYINLLLMQGMRIQIIIFDTSKLRFAMVSFVYLKNDSSRALAGELATSVYKVYDALSVAEAVWLCTQQHLGTIVVASNLEDSDTAQLPNCFITLRLRPDATVHQILWELARLFQGESAAAC